MEQPDHSLDNIHAVECSEEDIDKMLDAHYEGSGGNEGGAQELVAKRKWKPWERGYLWIRNDGSETVYAMLSETHMLAQLKKFALDAGFSMEGAKAGVAIEWLHQQGRATYIPLQAGDKAMPVKPQASDSMYVTFAVDQAFTQVLVLDYPLRKRWKLVAQDGDPVLQL